LDETIFKIALEEQKKKEGKSAFWQDLLEKFTGMGYNFKDKEDLRDKIRKEKKKRGIVGNINYPIKDDFSNSPRVAVLDIETLPAEVYTFRLYDQNIGIEQVISEIGFLSWAAKFLNEPEMYSDILTKEEAPLKDDERITRSCWDFLSKVNVLVGHNAQAFDSKLMNTFFLKYNLPPLKYLIVDTLLIAKSNFRFSSNKLKFINQQLGIRNKIDNDGFPLWVACHHGDQKSLDTMLEYNLGDIIATEELFYKLRPYIKNFNISLYNEIESLQCPVCGSTNLNIEGYYFTGNSGKYESVRCLDCKCISRKKQNLLGKEKKKNLLVNS
jgi:hypothetical protein